MDEILGVGIPKEVKLFNVVITLVGLDEKGEPWTAVTYDSGPFENYTRLEEGNSLETRKYTISFKRVESKNG